MQEPQNQIWNIPINQSNSRSTKIMKEADQWKNEDRIILSLERDNFNIEEPKCIIIQGTIFKWDQNDAMRVEKKATSEASVLMYNARIVRKQVTFATSATRSTMDGATEDLKLQHSMTSQTARIPRWMRSRWPANTQMPAPHNERRLSGRFTESRRLYFKQCQYDWQFVW